MVGWLVVVGLDFAGDLLGDVGIDGFWNKQYHKEGEGDRFFVFEIRRWKKKMTAEVKKGVSRDEMVVLVFEGSFMQMSQKKNKAWCVY